MGRLELVDTWKRLSVPCTTPLVHQTLAKLPTMDPEAVACIAFCAGQRRVQAGPCMHACTAFGSGGCGSPRHWDGASISPTSRALSAGDRHTAPAAASGPHAAACAFWGLARLGVLEYGEAIQRRLEREEAFAQAGRRPGSVDRLSPVGVEYVLWAYAATEEPGPSPAQRGRFFFFFCCGCPRAGWGPPAMTWNTSRITAAYRVLVRTQFLVPLMRPRTVAKVLWSRVALGPCTVLGAISRLGVHCPPMLAALWQRTTENRALARVSGLGLPRRMDEKKTETLALALMDGQTVATALLALSGMQTNTRFATQSGACLRCTRYHWAIYCAVPETWSKT